MGFIMSVPIILINTQQSPQLNTLDLVAIVTWFIGFIIESVADAQMYAFMHEHGKVVHSNAEKIQEAKTPYTAAMNTLKNVRTWFAKKFSKDGLSKVFERNEPVLQTGLWRYSRHPNYFGELVMWWSIFLLSLSAPYGYCGLICPLAITTTLLFISGIPWIEASMKNNSAYQEYARKTSILIPWFPKK
jgi:steroid 5-alpha reductase family enzyme